MAEKAKTRTYIVLLFAVLFFVCGVLLAFLDRSQAENIVGQIAGGIFVA